MIKLIAIVVLSSLVACGGGNTSPNPPAQGVVLSETCDGYTLVQELADGNGGTDLQRVEQSAECGWEEIEVIIEDSVGAFFNPVVVKVTGTAEWDYQASIGNVKETDTGLEITSDGRIGTGSLIFNGEEYFYEIEDDPKCLHTFTQGEKYKTDCEGYLVGGRSASMIWYGEEDTQIVTIELGVVRSMGQCNIGFNNDECVAGESIPPDNPYRVQVDEWIVEANQFNVRSKVYFKWKLTDMVWQPRWEDVFSFGGYIPLNEISDVVIGWGGSGNAGGQAFMPVSIYPTMATPRPVALSTGGTFMHELGHAMSLGHGVWGDPDWTLEGGPDLGWQGGGIFPRFGHGWSGKNGEGVCGAQGSVMSYSSKAMWTNSLLSCEELGYSSGNWGDAAGSRQQSDEAYALNRIRYSYSLIHNEHLHL